MFFQSIKSLVLLIALSFVLIQARVKHLNKPPLVSRQRARRSQLPPCACYQLLPRPSLRF